MCGIVGLAQSKRIDKRVLDAMTDSLSHRGPDDRGIFIDGNAGLGQRRLAILDLSPLGHQPMFSQNKRFVISFNGEIYNFQEIRAELKEKGYKFKSQTDTEVILAAYQEWGSSCQEKFNGMWAFIIYDRKEKKIFASRDRLGIKPLYYFFDGQTLALASEIKALLKLPDFKASVDLDALNEYFSFQNIFSDRTLFSGVKLLPPASYIEYKLGKIRIDSYWEPQTAKKELSADEWEEKVLETFKKAVKRHLISDVEVGSYLSGGMDSASIAAIASEENPNLKTFTGGFDLTSATGLEAAFDERKEAEAVAKLYSSEHYEMVMHSGSMQKIMPKLIWHLEDLRVGMCYPNYYISQLASKFVKVVLSGAAGDELFGGYPWRYNLIRELKDYPEFDRAYYDYWSRLVKDEEKPKLFTAETAAKMDFTNPYKEYRQVISPFDNLPPIEKALLFEIKTFLHGLFVVEDKVSMAHSIEVRVPFTDLELIELATSMPYDVKVWGDSGKVVLRKAMSHILPESIISKKKQGFSPPEGSWYRDESLKYVKEILLSEKCLSRGYFNPEYIQNIISEHVDGKVNHRLLIWSLLSFEWWCRVFLDKEKI